MPYPGLVPIPRRLDTLFTPPDTGSHQRDQKFDHRYLHYLTLLTLC